MRWVVPILALIMVVSAPLLSATESWAGAGGMSGQGVGGIGVPEPASLSLLAVGVAGVLAYRYGRNRRK